jgi:hypothetical protein
MLEIKEKINNRFESTVINKKNIKRVIINSENDKSDTVIDESNVNIKNIMSLIKEKMKIELHLKSFESYVLRTR